MNQYLPEWLAVKVSYIHVGSKWNHVIFTSSEQRSLIRWDNPVLTAIGAQRRLNS